MIGWVRRGSAVWRDHVRGRPDVREWFAEQGWRRPPTHYATLVTGRADASGEVEICNAGHLPPLLLRRGGGATLIEATGLPVGIFCNEEFTSSKLTMRPGDTLFLFTDGLSESRDHAGAEYSRERLLRLLCGQQELLPGALIDVCLRDLTDFRAGAPGHDDTTIMALRRA